MSESRLLHDRVSVDRVSATGRVRYIEGNDFDAHGSKLCVYEQFEGARSSNPLVEDSADTTVG